MKKLRIWLHYNIPRFYNCPDVIYVVWRDREYFIRKFNNDRYKW